MSKAARVTILMIASIALAGFSDSKSNDIDIVCFGSGNAIVNQGGSSAQIYNNYGDSANVNIQRRGSVNYQDAVYFKMINGVATIQIPRTLLPTLRGGKGGWFKVKKLAVSDREITGKAAVSFLNNPQFRIDRMNGVLQIASKKGQFFGNCNKVKRNTGAKF